MGKELDLGVELITLLPSTPPPPPTGENNALVVQYSKRILVITIF